MLVALYISTFYSYVSYAVTMPVMEKPRLAPQIPEVQTKPLPYHFGQRRDLIG